MGVRAAPGALRGGGGGLAGYRDRGILTDSDLLAAMDREGVDGAVLATSASHYGFDNSYALEAAARSERFRVVGRLDPLRADLDWIAEWRGHPATAGLRLLALSDEERALTAGMYDSAFAFAFAFVQRSATACRCACTRWATSARSAGWPRSRSSSW